MCSSSRCDLPGLINGPVGNIVGIGIKALLNGAPIGPRNSEALRKPTEKENIQQFYDNVETHLRGALQVLQPALEIKRILGAECRSAGPERSVSTPAPPIVYYSPQNPPKSQTCSCPIRCCGVKKSANCTGTEKSCVSKASVRYCNDKSTDELAAKSSLSTTACSKKSTCSKRSVAKNSSPCSARGTRGDRSNGGHEHKGKASEAKPPKYKRAKCCVCEVTLKDNIALAALPCEHSFCYTCLAKAKSARCQKCEKSYDMKNVSQIFHTG